MRDGDGITALMEGAKNGNMAIVNALLDAGADIHTVDDLGNTALMYAEAGRHKAVAHRLMARGAKRIPMPYGFLFRHCL